MDQKTSRSVIVSDGNLIHVADVLHHNRLYTGSAGIKKGWPINVIARPFKANIQARVLLHLLDLGHVVLTSGT